MPKNFRVENAPRPISQGEVNHPLARGTPDIAKEFTGPGDAMRRQQDIVQLSKAVG
jgi:hypothetical protein